MYHLCKQCCLQVSSGLSQPCAHMAGSVVTDLTGSDIDCSGVVTMPQLHSFANWCCTIDPTLLRLHWVTTVEGSRVFVRDMPQVSPSPDDATQSLPLSIPNQKIHKFRLVVYRIDTAIPLPIYTRYVLTLACLPT